MYTKNNFGRSNLVSILSATLVLWKISKLFLSEITMSTAINLILRPFRRCHSWAALNVIQPFTGPLTLGGYCPFLQPVCFSLPICTYIHMQMYLQRDALHQLPLFFHLYT